MQDGRRIARNAALMLLKQAIMAVLGVVFVGYLARKVGVAAWGEFQASLATAGMVTLVAGVGVRGYLAREVAVRPELGPRHLGAALAIRGVTGTLVLGATAAVALATRSGLGAQLVVLAAASQLATLLYSTMWLSFEAHERFQYILYAELGARLFVIALAAALLALGFGVVAAATAFLLGNVLELGITYHFLRARLYRPELSTPPAELWEITKRSLPIGALGVLASALLQTDRVMLRALCDEEAVGVYSAAWVLSESFRMLPDVLLGAAFAAGMRLYAQDGEAFGRLYSGCMLVAALVGLPVAAGLFVLAPDVIRLVYGTAADYAPAADVLRILACSVPVMFAFQVVTLPLLAAKREVAMVKLLALTLAANVALNLLLLPRYRALGAAGATLAASTGSLLASWIMTARWARFVAPGRVLAILAATALMGVAAYAARALAGMWASIAVGVAVYVVLLVALRAVSFRELRALLARRVRASPAAAT
ncbi:polysaccharide biosynthesis protein [Sorangium cellulosum]|uniref:Polysaccharide biosynthesis protein n=1 Tax=Sorangium cellulosum TaxID=56 RepID=A0A4P2Q1N4_SORCE|nr:flippase [Sorangium cellulosum]AUX23175.1 polysaccharide biosynthesis protein [Sorangium cellulosum]